MSCNGMIEWLFHTVIIEISTSSYEKLTQIIKCYYIMFSCQALLTLVVLCAINPKAIRNKYNKAAALVRGF